MSLHEPFTDCVLSQREGGVCAAGGGLKPPTLTLSLKLIFFLLQLSSDDRIHFLLKALVLETHLWECVSLVLALAIMIVL